MKILVTIILTAIVLITLTAIALSGPSDTAEPAEPAEPKQVKQQKPPANASPTAKENDLVYALMSTSKGDILLELDSGKAPKTVANFVSYADKGMYDDTIFHRVIENFMIQGGGFTADLDRRPTDPPIKNEWRNGLKNKRGTIAMARTSSPDSATSQFFINVVDNASLDLPRGGATYAVFGRVVAGMAVVDAIRVVPIARKGPHANCPVEPVVIKKVKQITAEDAKKLIERDKAKSGG